MLENKNDFTFVKKTFEFFTKDGTNNNVSCFRFLISLKDLKNIISDYDYTSHITNWVLLKSLIKIENKKRNYCKLCWDNNNHKVFRYDEKGNFIFQTNLTIKGITARTKKKEIFEIATSFKYDNCNLSIAMQDNLYLNDFLEIFKKNLELKKEFKKNIKIF